MKKTTKTRTKRTLKFGNDGYDCKNVTAKATRHGIEISKTDPHDWGRVSQYMFIRKEDVRELALFLIDQIESK